jgi:dihydrofolate reductase
MKIALIVAMAKNRVIGANNQIPWHLSADLKRFKQLTNGYPLLMGRKTHESIGRALPGRRNLLISRNSHYQARGCEVFTTIEAAIEACSTAKRLFVIGGSSLYQALLNRADLLYLTEIQTEFLGDTYFPKWNHNDWQLLEQLDINDDPSVDFNYRFLTYQRANLIIGDGKN